jgi:hypothetical protein
VLAQNGEYDKGLVIKDFSKENIKEIKYQSDMDLHITCDFNVDPMAWILAHKTEDKVFFFDELVIENTTTAKACDEFYHRYPNHRGKIIINGMHLATTEVARVNLQITSSFKKNLRDLDMRM